tara:strand:+ start:1744 stop:2358 length:615 start_codon:yes stop_codon:yes gene_type:complete
MNKKENYLEVLTFAKAIAGEYSNKAQAQSQPQKYAHINIYFSPLPWSFFQCIGFYSEQTFDHNPWSPYRQSIHKLIYINDTFILKNYSISCPKRFAGTRLEPKFLNKIERKMITKKEGCNMIFKKINNNHYIGSVEPGEGCIIKRNGLETYLVSKVEIKDNMWISIDEGYRVNTRDKVWGSMHGPLLFNKVKSLDKEFIQTVKS